LSHCGGSDKTGGQEYQPFIACRHNWSFKFKDKPKLSAQLNYYFYLR
jgi:hypothetical protein